MKIGIFGGAFDPIHSEHVALIKAVKKEVSPDKLLLVPTKEPPHKTGLIAPFYDRAQMLTLAFPKDCEVSLIEEELNGKNYSVNLARALKKRYPGDELMFIIGSDSLRDLKIWHKPEELCKAVTLVVVPRKDKDDVLESAAFAEAAYGARVIVTEYAGENLSSSVLKAKLLLGLDVGDAVPAAVQNYIKKNNLFRIYDDLLSQLQRKTSHSLFAHATRTALFALGFCSALALPFQKVFWAAILHDVAKGRDLTAVPGIPTAVLHQFYGAEVAKAEFQVNDADVLDAIRYHTTGRAGMSKLEQLIYAADKLEEGRTYPEAEVLRAALREDFNAGFAKLVTDNYRYLRSQGAEIHPLQQECYTSFKGEIK